MKENNLENEDVKDAAKHDFIKEYEEIMNLLHRDMETIKRGWQENGERIKKFTLFKNTPTPILTDHTTPI